MSKVFKIIAVNILLCLLAKNTIFAQSLCGTTWNITVPAVSSKPYNFIFAVTGNKGNVLKANGKLADFTWKEDGKGNFTIQIAYQVDGVTRYEIFYGKISGNSGVGFYSNSLDKKNPKSINMTRG